MGLHLARARGTGTLRLSLRHFIGFFRRPNNRLQSLLAFSCSSKLPAPRIRADVAGSAVRSTVGHSFTGQTYCMKLSARTIGIGRADLMVGMVNLACNFNGFVWLDARTAPAWLDLRLIS